LFGFEMRLQNIEAVKTHFSGCLNGHRVLSGAKGYRIKQDDAHRISCGGELKLDLKTRIGFQI